MIRHIFKQSSIEFLSWTELSLPTTNDGRPEGHNRRLWDVFCHSDLSWTCDCPFYRLKSANPGLSTTLFEKLNSCCPECAGSFVEPLNPFNVERRIPNPKLPNPPKTKRSKKS